MRIIVKPWWENDAEMAVWEIRGPLCDAPNKSVTKNYREKNRWRRKKVKRKKRRSFTSAVALEIEVPLKYLTCIATTSCIYLASISGMWIIT